MQITLTFGTQLEPDQVGSSETGSSTTVAASHVAREQTLSCEGADRHTPGPSFAPSNWRVVGDRLDAHTPLQ